MRYIFIAILICSGINLTAQEISIDNSDFFYQIAPIFEFKQSIVSLTFDDGSVNQFKIALPLLKEKRIPATFYVITNLVDSIIKRIILDNLSKDYEIGSHTVTHANLIKIGSEEAKRELLNSKSFLNHNFGINAGLTMSYPWGIYNNSVILLVKENYLAARSTGPGYNSLYNLDRYGLQVQGFDERTRPSRANSWVDYAIQNQLWLVEMIHGIDHVGYSPVDSKVLAEHLDYIKEVKDKVWCSTVSNVIKYLDESKNTDIKCENCNDTIYNIRINDFMDDSIYNQKLSIRIKVPANWDSIRISNSEKVRTEYFNESKFIIFNALPDNQLLTIRPGSISVPVKESGIRLVYLSANPFPDNLKLSLEVLDQRNIDIVLCDMNGKLLFHQEEKNAIGVINLFFNTQGISSGLYLLRIRSNGSDYIIKKLIKI
jgi:Predicted xylanase/chitin deacetylase